MKTSSAAVAALLAAGCANVLNELSYRGIFDLKSAASHQRMAVGDLTVSQPGTALMFARDGAGNAGLEVPAPNTLGDRVEVEFGKTTQCFKPQGGIRRGRQTFGYASFNASLIEAETPLSKQVAVKDALISAGLYTP